MYFYDLHETRKPTTVQLTSKFTIHVVFSCVFFEVLISTRIMYASEEIACVVLLTSFMWPITRTVTYGEQTTRASTRHSTRTGK